MSKYYFAKLKAEVSIQFHTDKKTHTTDLTLTVNPTKDTNFWDNHNMFRLGYKMAEDELLDEKEKEALIRFFEGFKHRLEEKKDERKQS